MHRSMMTTPFDIDSGIYFSEDSSTKNFLYQLAIMDQQVNLHFIFHCIQKLIYARIDHCKFIALGSCKASMNLRARNSKKPSLCLMQQSPNQLFNNHLISCLLHVSEVKEGYVLWTAKQVITPRKIAMVIWANRGIESYE